MNKHPPLFVIRIFEKIRTALDRMRRKTAPAPIALLEIVLGHWVSQAVIVAAELNVAEYLKDGPQDIAALARKTKSHEESLYRLLRLLSSVGIFREESQRRFKLTPLARPLLGGEPDSIRSFVLLNGLPFHWRAWGELRKAVQTGQSALEILSGQGLFEYLQSHPEDGKIFDQAMTSVSAQSAPAVTSAIDFSRYPVIADIGGGRGSFLSMILCAHPASRGILFDQAHVVAEAEDVLRQHGVIDRCEILPGSFFATIPPQADAYILKNIVHDWSDAKSVQILRGIREAMKPNSVLFLIETVVPEGNSYHPGKLIDLEMLVGTPGGKERTRQQLEALFSQAGLRLARIHPTAALESVVEAVRL